MRTAQRCGIRMFMKILFLFAYFLLLFLIVRFLEFYVTSLAGCSCLVKYFYEYLPLYIYGSSTNSQNDNIINHKDNTSPANDNEDDLNKAASETTVGADKDFEFLTYGDFIENVEDTKASIWVVNVYSPGHAKHVLNKRKWNLLSNRLQKYGIRTGTYRCKKDLWLCLRHKIIKPTVILAMPKGSQPKGNVALFIYNIEERDNPIDTKSDIFNWVQSKLYRKVKMLHSISELTERPVTRRKNTSAIPSISFIYHSNNHVPPLLLSALSVKFTGRIKFYMLKTEEKLPYGNTFAMTESATYSYGKHNGESFNYTCMELFLRTLYPEVNDVFIFSIVLLNMACWLELFLQKGGPLRRLLFYLWGFALANFILFFIWLPVIQLLYMPQLQPIIEISLRSLQQVMFTNIAAIVRQDFLQLSQHMYVVFIGFICYGVVIGYLRYKLRNDTSRQSQTMVSLFDEDIQELNDLFRSLLAYITPSLQVYRFEERIERILHRLSTPDLWLHPVQSADFVCDLPVWGHCEKRFNPEELILQYSSESEFFSDNDQPEIISKKLICLKCHVKNPDQIPEHVLSATDCVICLAEYECKELVSGLPCGHSFHKNCIEEWFFSGTSYNKYRCPICRWPADLHKGKFEIIDATE